MNTLNNQPSHHLQFQNHQSQSATPADSLQQNNQISQLTQNNQAPYPFAQSPVQQRILSPTQNNSNSSQKHHNKSNTIVGQQQQQVQFSEIQRQKYILQQSSLYAKSGSKLKTVQATLNAAKNTSNISPGLQYDNLNWVFLKNDHMPKTNPSSKNHSFRGKKKFSKNDILNNSGGLLSDNTSLDSNDRSLAAAPVNFADILQKHEEPANIEADITQLQEYQQQYNIEDDDSPSQVLEKIQHQIHDQMCVGPGESDKDVGFLLNLSKVIAKTNDSLDSNKNNNTNITERIPKINGFSAKIKQQPLTNQNSARHSQAQNIVIGGSSSNFQSFKKNAMKLPKVNMRTSLINQYTSSNKISSMPISPRLFEQAKFGVGSNNGKKSQNDSGIAQADNSNLLQTSGNSSQLPFALPLIEKTTQQSTTYFENSNSGALIDHQNTQGANSSGSGLLLQQNRSSTLNRDPFSFKQPSNDYDALGDLSQDQLQQHHSVQTSVVNQNQQEVSFLTETKVEVTYKQRFTLNSLRAKALQSPQQQILNQYQQQQQQVRNSSTGSYKNNEGSIVIQKSSIQRYQLNNSQTALNKEPTQLQQLQNQLSPDRYAVQNICKKICSSCHKVSTGHKKKQFSFDFQHLEVAQMLKEQNKINKSNLNQSSCLSDSQLDEMSDKNEIPPLVKLRQNQLQINNIINKGGGNSSFNDYDNNNTNNTVLTPAGQTYNPLRDNAFFNKFANKYNSKLLTAFEDVDRLNNSGTNHRLNTSTATLKQDVLAYMEQHSEIRRLMKDEASKTSGTNTPVINSGKVKKLIITKQQLQQSMIQQEGSTIHNYHQHNSDMNAQANINDLSNEKKQLNDLGKSQQIKYDRMKNYGRWYLKPQEFNRIIMKNKKKDQNEEDESQENCSMTIVEDMNTSHQLTHKNTNYFAVMEKEQQNNQSQASQGSYGNSGRGRGGPYKKNYNNDYYQDSNNYYDNRRERGGDGYSNNYRGRGEGNSYRGGYNQRGGAGGGRGGYYQNDKYDQPQQKTVVAPTQTASQPLKKKGKAEFTSDFDKAFGFSSSSNSNNEVKTSPEPVKQQQEEQKQEPPTQQDTKQTEVVTTEYEKQDIKEEVKVEEETKQTEVQKIEQSQQNQSNHQYYDRYNNQRRDYYNKKDYHNKSTYDRPPPQNGKYHNNKHQNYKPKDQADASKPTTTLQETQVQPTPAPVVEEQKKPVKQDFVPDENFSWDLDLESVDKSKKKKNTKKADDFTLPVVIKSDPSKSALKEHVKLKLAENLEFSTLHIDKVNKGFTNSTNCCYMNVCLQSLLSIPAFYNMLIAISENQEVMKELSPDCLLRKFVYLSLYFSPKEQMDKKSPFSAKTVDAENIFQEINKSFNPYAEHQDCHEFLALLLDLLHDELALIYVPPDNEDKGQVVDEWQEVGNKNAKIHFNNDHANIKPSLVREIFGGVVKNEFHIENSKHTSVNFEPFFILNLEVNKCEDLESCLHSFFDEKRINDYKLDGREVRASHHQQIDKLPNILILHLKRFIYRDRPIKMKEDIYFPEVLKIEDYCLSTGLKLGAFSNKQVDESGRHYRLISVVNHRGNELFRGHYVTYVLDASNEWILYDDNKFKKVHKDTVFESQAYLLFYELIQ